MLDRFDIKKFIRRLEEALAIALMYVVMAKLGFIVAIPPGNVTVLWLPSGVAVTAVLLLGYYAGIGIWLGSFITNLLFFSTTAATPLISLATASSIAIGSTLQAFLAAFLIRHFIGLRFPKESKEIFKFIALIALSCFVASTIGVTSLTVTNTIPWNKYIYTWLTWWLGDFAGILTLTPCLLLLLGPAKQDGLARFPLPLVGMGIGLTVISFSIVWELTQSTIVTQFKADANRVIFALRRNIEIAEQSLEFIAAVYNSSKEELDQEQFHTLAQPLLKDNPVIHAFSWAPRIMEHERTAFEQAMREKGYPDFQITELDDKGKLVKAGLRPEYFPIYLRESIEPNKQILGFDINSEKVRRHTINQVRTMKQHLISAPVQLAESPEQTIFLSIWPIYRKDKSAPHDRPPHFLGITIGTFKAAPLVEGALNFLQKKNMGIYLFDTSPGSDEQAFYFHSSLEGQKNSAVNIKQVRAGLNHAEQINIGGRNWLIICKPENKYLIGIWLPLSVLIIGLSFTGCLLAYINVHARATQALSNANKALVQYQEQTNKLTEANRTLQLEMGKRERAEEQIALSLKEKEVLLKEIYHRVKNNLQIVSSLLSLQARKSKDRNAVQILQEGANRIKTMSLIHEQLYQSQDLGKIDLSNYAQGLVNYLLDSYGTSRDKIDVKVRVKDVTLGIQSAIPSSLIINELVSNALKHAFPYPRTGAININIDRGEHNQIVLQVADNGIGFPETIDFRKSSSLGLQLVCALTEQNQGNITLNRNGGTTFTVTLHEL